MLAYVFWHQRRGDVRLQEYQQRLLEYHRALQQRLITGFSFSFVLEVPYLPWMSSESEVYEDWYLLENSAALDHLDQAAITGSCEQPHNALARLADNGTGALYRLKGEPLDPTRLKSRTLHTATWFAKPDGMSYDQLYSDLQAYRSEQPDILWQRQMTMGPAYEFCLHGYQSLPLPESWLSVEVITQPLFIGGRAPDQDEE